MATHTLEQGIMPRKKEQLQESSPVYASSIRPEVERDYLSALMANMCAGHHIVDECFAICPPEYALTPDVRPYLDAIYELRQRGEETNILNLLYTLRRKHAEDPARWGAPRAWEIAEMCESYAGSILDPLAMAARLADIQRLFALHADLLKVAEEANYYGVSAEDIAAKARAVADDVAGVQSVPSMHDLMLKIMTRVSAGTMAESLLRLPWDSLNRVLRGGFQGRELIILAGRPGTGKTAFAGCIAVETAKSGQGVLFVSREMGDESLGARMLAREARVDNRFYREGLAGDDVAQKLWRSSDVLASLPLSIVEKSRGPFCPREVRRLARGIKNIGLVVVDYLQLMHPDEPSKSREQDISSMSRAFKLLAMDLGVPVLLLSQLNRKLEEADREPFVSDLRESGAIEQDADIILLLHTRRAERTSSTPMVKCIVGKSRNTQTGAVHFGFEKAFSNFAERQEQAQEWQHRAAGNDL